MKETADQNERTRQAEQTRVAHKAAIQGVAERNEAAHQVAKKKRAILDKSKAETRRNADH
jgi:hypothetical protein